MQEEVFVILAIYQDFIQFKDNVLHLNFHGCFCKLLLGNYPLEIPNLYIELPRGKSLQEEQMALESLQVKLQELFIPGEAILYDFIDYLYNFVQDYSASDQQVKSVEQESSVEQEESFEQESSGGQDLNSVEQEVSSGQEARVDGEGKCPKIYSSEPWIESKSIFIAHVATVETIEQIELVKSSLLQDKSIQKATHPLISAYIINQGSITKSDYDDDGEAAAGKRLLHLLQLCKCQNVLVVVSRWFGGIHLGPKRFKIINNCARKLLDEQGFIK